MMMVSATVFPEILSFCGFGTLFVTFKQSLWSAAWFAMAIWSCASATTDSGPSSDADAPGDSPYNPLPYGHPYPGLPSYQQPFHQTENIKIVYVEKPSAPNSGGYGQPYHPHPHPEPYRPEDPKANCTLEEVKREEEICGPGRLDKECQIVKVDYMKISTEEQVNCVKVQLSLFRRRKCQAI